MNKISADPAATFGTPQAVLGAKELDAEQKKKILKQWDYDLRLQLVASDEYMTGDGRGGTAETLRQVYQALEKLGALPDSDKTGTPHKTGEA